MLIRFLWSFWYDQFHSQVTFALGSLLVLIPPSLYPEAPSRHHIYLSPINTSQYKHSLPPSPLPHLTSFALFHILLLPPLTVSSHPQSVSYLPSTFHPLCPNSLSQPYILFPSSWWPPPFPLFTYTLFLIFMEKKTVPTSILYYITSLGMIVLLACLNVDRQSPFLSHPEFPLPECLKPKYWFLLFHLIGTL